MPMYQFTGPIGDPPDPIELADDRAAWSEAVIYFGRVLSDIDGNLPGTTDLKLDVREGSRHVATIEIVAKRG